MTAAEFTALYLITVLSYRFPGTWPGSKNSQEVAPHHQLTLPLEPYRSLWETNIQKRLAAVSCLGDIFNQFALRSTPLTVNRSILNWSSGDYGLELMFRIPRPEEVLEQQQMGRRCVTVLTAAEKTSRFILGERDALGFTMHDLIHADHFYHHNQCYQGQLGFYGLLAHCLKNNHFSELIEVPAFAGEFDYLISDMNAYAIHLLKCLKSALIHYHPEKDQFFLRWLQSFSLSAEEASALLNLNTTEYMPSQQDEILLEFLSRWKKS